MAAEELPSDTTCPCPEISPPIYAEAPLDEPYDSNNPKTIPDGNDSISDNPYFLYW
eukprot:CAMPEP_0201583242 /NCGR_PEP_ID=MMETSP0190_2-20130828/96208_1 /ASSEMBLY_ACC=CAM_ASM_000263 /TAXON_ID=37353 /ORGANISM="Rosalina sp." /LENGTH=55 /DNA_ID=CAMNT_0048024785 /DNA_START=29 /DNA_END=193 /DNA_ORIENTATION=+